ncbi:hypothetical protein GQ457_01G012640 [Hibiscus cannabinus]
MNSSDLLGSLRKELQGPRPAPLKVRKDSHKIKKPQSAPQQQQQQPSQIRPPVIIYIASPKVIHTNPSDFMNLVQRLTGSTSLSDQTDAAISPAARFASIEMTKSPHGKRPGTDAEFYVKGCELLESYIRTENLEVVQGTEIEMNPGVERANLSPGPTSLPPVPPSFFSSPRSDPDSIGFFHDLSPGPGSFMPSPSSFHIPPSYLLPSPIAPSIDLFNNFFNL